jgi:hypothetical protein
MPYLPGQVPVRVHADTGQRLVSAMAGAA